MSMNKFKQTGFTLLELMVLLAIVGIVVAIGVPSFKHMFVTNEIVSVTNDLTISFKLARSEAITQGRNTIVCSSSDGSTCSLSGGSWKNGWIVGIDYDESGQIDEANGELLWVREEDVGYDITINTLPIPKSKFEFRYDGWLNDNELGIDICSGYGPTDGYPVREIRSTRGGATTMKKDLTRKC